MAARGSSSTNTTSAPPASLLIARLPTVDAVQARQCLSSEVASSSPRLRHERLSRVGVLGRPPGLNELIAANVAEAFTFSSSSVIQPSWSPPSSRELASARG